MAICEDCPLREICEFPECYEDFPGVECKNKGPLDFNPYPPSILLKNLPLGEDLAYEGVICSNEEVVRFALAHVLKVYASEINSSEKEEED